MTSIKPFQMEDLFDLNSVNLDPLTENFNLQFYFSYLTEWPSLFFKSVEINNQFGNDISISGYMMGKNEGSMSRKEWHTHITAVTVDAHYRRISMASFLCKHLENIVKKEPYNTLFIDLFVKVTNNVAQSLYNKLDYSIYRRVIGYYGSVMPTDRTKVDDNIDAFDMRKSLPRDVNKETIRKNGSECNVLPNEVVF